MVSTGCRYFVSKTLKISGNLFESLTQKKITPFLADFQFAEMVG
jgi:hypothetical protein